MKRGFVRFCFKALILLFISGVIGAFFAYKSLSFIYSGNYDSFRNLFVASVMETKKGRFLAEWFLSPEEISDIRNGRGRIDTSEDEIVPDEKDEKASETEAEETVSEFDINGTEFIEISGSTYKGYLLIVNDPSRVSVYTSYPFTEEGGKGKKLYEMAEEADAFAAVNGGAFLYLGGDMPKGITISDGQTLSGEYGEEYTVIGFNYDNRLIVGEMTLEDAEILGFRDALSFSPILVKDGTPRNVSAYSLGLNPRTAIGQRADGAVLLLVIEGRQPHSLGANYQDLVDVMVKYGAVNAATLDGGSSSVMYYDGEIISKCCSLYGPGRIPTCFIVSKVTE